MAVQPQTPYKEYTANGSTNSFALEFDCDNQDHLIVLVDDIEPIVGAWSLIGGAVVFGTAPTNGKKITIQRNTPFRRDGDFQSYDNSFRPGPVNKGFDWVWLKLQELGVADWILSNRIDALKSYVNQQDGILQDNIDSLKNYVDDKDDELRNYLLNAIQEQGVALDQLEEYYSYLMQQLAQVAIDRGWDASFVVSADGSTQQQVNDRIGNTWYAKPLGYELNARVMLENGDIVKSTAVNNIIDPNVDMTGWMFDDNTVESIADLIAIQNPKDGQVVHTKSYHEGINKGGTSYYYDSTKSTINNGGSIINGWVAIGEINSVTQWGAKGDGASNDSVAFQNAVDNLNKVYIPEGIFLCNVTLSRWFNLRGSGKGTILKPFNTGYPVLTNINRQSLGWYNDTIFDLDIQSVDATGTGFSYGVLPASNDYYGVGRVAMHNVRFIALNHGIRKVNGNIGNKYYNCSFEYCNYGVYATSNQAAINGSTFIMHSGCDAYYTCNFSENIVSGVAYYDKTHGTGQWVFDNCVFQFNHGFGMFFDFDIPDNLFAPILILNTWFEENGGNQVLIDRVGGTAEVMTSLPKFVSGTNDVIVIGGEDYKTRVGIGVLNPKRTLHIHDKTVPMIQLTSDTTGSTDEFRGGQIFFSYPDLYLNNAEGGRLYLNTVAGKVEIDPLGNLVSRKGKVGYGKGAGNIVTQTGNKDTLVTCNSPSGRIITAAQSLAAGAMTIFILNNSYITAGDVLVTNVRFSPSNSARYYDISVTNISDGTCHINIKNSNSIALAESIEISFCIITGSIDPVY